jgi:hypothetical protein
MPTYSGSCHCGRVRFAVEAEIEEVRACDCSICQRRGALIHRVAEEQFRLLSSWDDLTTYKWNTRQATDYFCSHCGILPFRRPRTAPHLWAINVRCLEGIAIDALRILRVHGSRLD